MRWPWQRREAPAPQVSDDEMGPGHPLWPVVEEAMSLKQPMAAIWDRTTGKVIKVVPLSELNDELNKIKGDTERGEGGI